MSGEMEISPSSLRDGGRNLADVAGRLAKEWQDIQTTSSSIKFGNDIVSSLLEGCYSAALELANKTYGGAVKGLGGFGDGLSAIADIHDGYEQANTEVVKNLGKTV
jgi:hypothetical protein